LAKLPTINSLKQEYAALVADKKKLYASQSTARKFMQEILMAQQNVQMLICGKLSHDVWQNVR